MHNDPLSFDDNHTIRTGKESKSSKAIKNYIPAPATNILSGTSFAFCQRELIKQPSIQSTEQTDKSPRFPKTPFTQGKN